MKTKYIIALFIFAYLLEAIGVHFKIMHLSGAPQLFTASFVLKVLSGGLAIWKLITTKKFQDFLDS